MGQPLSLLHDELAQNLVEASLLSNDLPAEAMREQDRLKALLALDAEAKNANVVENSFPRNDPPLGQSSSNDCDVGDMAGSLDALPAIADPEGVLNPHAKHSGEIAQRSASKVQIVVPEVAADSSAAGLRQGSKPSLQSSGGEDCMHVEKSSASYADDFEEYEPDASAEELDESLEGYASNESSQGGW